MKWPPYLLDSNPIENLQASIKAEIYCLYPKLEHASDIDGTLNDLVHVAQEAQQAIDTGILYRLLSTIAERV